MPPLRLAREDVRQVHLDERHINGGERVANGETRVRVRPGVDQCAICLSTHGVDSVDQLALAVVLSELHFGANFPSDHAEPFLDVAERCATVDFGLARAEQIEARPIQHGDAHYFLSWSSHVLNSSISLEASGEPSRFASFCSSKNWSNVNPDRACGVPDDGVRPNTWSSDSSSSA